MLQRSQPEGQLASTVLLTLPLPCVCDANLCLLCCPFQVARSMVIDSKTGESRVDDVRTSYGASFG